MLSTYNEQTGQYELSVIYKYKCFVCNKIRTTKKQSRAKKAQCPKCKKLLLNPNQLEMFDDPNLSLLRRVKNA